MTDTTKTKLSLQGYARSRRARRLPGGSLAQVQRAVAGGRIRLEADGTVDECAADLAWESSTDATRRPHTSSNGHGPPSSLAAAKTQESRERTRRLKVEADLLEGRVVLIAEVEQAWARLIVETRLKLQAIPIRAKQQLPQLRPEDLAVLDALICEALEDLAQGRGAGAAEATA
jgi:phage terminase Nu1 subunit (DNA packaging protein)